MMKCPQCNSTRINAERTPNGKSLCLDCSFKEAHAGFLINESSAGHIGGIVDAESLKTELRPSHYEKGKDTFAWAEERYSKSELVAIADFNIHKYFNRDKGQEASDAGKVADYSLWKKRILEKEDC